MADLDASVPDMDTVSRLLPLSYRLAILMVLGIWLWGVNLQVLRKHGIDTPSLIAYPARTDPPPHKSAYRFAAVLSSPLAVSLVTYWLLTRGQAKDVAASHILPDATLVLTITLAFILPGRWLYPRHYWPMSGRSRLLTTLRRISIGGLAHTPDGKFGDVLLADALTSYARPLSEIWIAGYMMVHGQSTTGRLDRSSLLAVPIILMVPFLIRLRQCITDHQPFNMLKYATALPAIALSVAASSSSQHADERWIMPASILALLVNAGYSFWWDVTKDWDLTLLTSRRTAGTYPVGLRPHRVFDDYLYYGMVVVDLFLRLAWALKLSPLLEGYFHIEGGMFALELTEVMRRWLWVFFRVETEWVRSQRTSNIFLEDRV